MNARPLLALVPLAAGLTTTPAGPAPQEKPYTVRVEVALVNLDVAVVDARGEFVAGLSGNNFRVFEDDRPQTLTHFASLEAPLAVALLVETSPAVYLIHDEHWQAVSLLLERLRPRDAVALARYDQSWQAVTGFATDRLALRQHLRQLNYSLGMAELNLFDALARTLDWLSTSPDTLPGRKAILLIGTGLDTGSRTSLAEVRERLAASGVTLSAVSTGSLLRAPAEEKPRKRKKGDAQPGDADAAFAAADAQLRALAEDTGGRAYLPRSAADVRRAYQEIGRRLRHTYSVGYVPENRARDGRFRALRVELVADNGQALPYRVIARRGYLAPRD